jgi:hypothetical protein
MAACAPQLAGDGTIPRAAAEYRAFGAPQRVTIRGYDGDAMELFFTRISGPIGSHPVILRSSRHRPDESFGMPERVSAITGHVEAPALSGDGRALYYHKLDGNRFVICRTKR